MAADGDDAEMERELEAQIQEQGAALADIDDALALEASDELQQARSHAAPSQGRHHPPTLHPTPPRSPPWLLQMRAELVQAVQELEQALLEIKKAKLLARLGAAAVSGCSAPHPPATTGIP